MLFFEIVCKEVGDSQRCELYSQSKCPACQHDTIKELCLVQLMEIHDNQQLVIDPAVKVLRCIWVRWRRTPGDSSGLFSAFAFGLIPVESIRGIVHDVRWDWALLDIYRDVSSWHRYEELFEVEKRWATQVFNSNRFMRPCRTEYKYCGWR